MYPGDGLVRRGDVVVASVNHRLGALGVGNLMDFGEQYASSPNVGMLDIVAALEWVKTNNGNFGGDPNKVLIFGQSGGGGKVLTLMSLPNYGASRGFQPVKPRQFCRLQRNVETDQHLVRASGSR